MTLISHGAALRFASVSTLALAVLAAGTAHAADSAIAAGATAGADQIAPPEVQEIVVTASKGKAASVAPVSSSLKATEPEAIITRKFIEEAAPRVGDYTTSAILAPSMATTPNPNGPGATDGAKITLRGFADGSFNVTYDGIAWGDTNGPTHHSTSFFPSSVIGGIVIDRGPGRADDFGQANFGGSVNLFSLPLEDHFGFQQTATIASYGTLQEVTTVETGPLAQLHDANFVFNFMEYKTDGYLSNSPSNGNNQFVKGSVPITPKIILTGLFTRNEDAYNQGDQSNATVAQQEAFGKRFGLSTDPTLSTDKNYNDTHKQTDFEYIRLNADLDHGFKAENTVYSYFYGNFTLSANNDAADSTLGATALAAADKVTLTPSTTYPAGGSGYSKTLQVNGLPGYTKRNEYRVIGDIAKFSEDFGFGVLSFGAEYEHAFTQRQRFDLDLLTGLSDYREKAAIYPGPSGCANLAMQVAPGKTYNGACEEPLNTAYSEFSGWNQYQPFIEFDWKPIPGLTITPGVKYVDFDLFVHAPALAVSGSIQPTYVDQDFTKTLPFFTANYRIRSTWSVYAQYAQGFLVPNVSAFYVNTPQNNKVVPQESTNYQFGTVFSAGDLTFDGDLYYIDFMHKIQTLNNLVTGETYETNSGGAHYKGVEAQATYALPQGLSVFINGSLNQATAVGDPLNPAGNGHQLALAPRWTAADGVRSQLDHLIFADDQLVTNVNTKWIGEQYETAASGAARATGLIHSFNQTDLSSTYRISHYSVEFQLLNIFDHEDITSFKGKALQPFSNLPATTVAQGGGANVLTYQTGRSFQLTFKAAF